jgi:monoamine oxidase
MSPHRPASPWKIGIIGGGPGGLLTARMLERHALVPPAITIFEASDRLGGKVLTKHFDTLRVAYEVGAAEFYDYARIDEDPLKELVQDLGLPLQVLGGSSLIHDERLIGNLDDLRDSFGSDAAAALVDFHHLGRDRLSPREFYEALPVPQLDGPAGSSFESLLDGIASPAARRHIERFIHSDLATEPTRTSRRYGLENYLMNDPAYMQLYCIAGGNEQLITAIASQLAADIRLNTPVLSVGQADDGRMAVEVAAGDRRETHRFDALVIALPIEPLRQLQFASDRLQSAIGQHIRHHDHPAHYLRISILFDNAFWRGRWDDAYCMLEGFDGCCLYDESARDPAEDHGVLGWLIGGEAAVRWSERNDEAIIQAALDALPTWLGEPARQHLLEARVHRWIGAVSALPGGWQPLPLDRRHQPEPSEHPTLFTVGDYLFDSTLNGVHDSAEYVADWLATLMRERPGLPV